MKKLLIIIISITFTSIAFSQATGTWTEIDNNTEPIGRNVHQIVNYSDNQALMFGGYLGPNPGPEGSVNETWVYNHNTMTWSELTTANPPSERIAHAMAKVNDDRILVYSGNSNPVDHWLFDISSNSWTELTPASSSTYYSEASMVGLKDDMVLLFGGTSGGGPGSGDETWVFDYVDDNSYSWTKLDIANPPPKRFAHQLARIDNNKALMFGGLDENDNSLNDTWIFDYSSKTWYEINSTVTPAERDRFSMSKISDQYIFMYGGYARSDTWLFDIENEEWIEIDNLTSDPGQRVSYTSAQLSEGKVVIFSGAGRPQDTWVFSLSFTKPVIYTSNVSDISETSASFNINLFNGEASTTYTFDYGTATNDYSFSFSNTLTGNSTTVNVGFEDDENLMANTQYFVRASATNSVTWTESEEISFWTLADEPAAHSTLTQIGEEDNTIELSFDALSAITNGNGYLILRSATSIGDNDLPTDGNSYNVDDIFGNSTVVAKITDNTATSHTFNNLSKEQSWQFALVPYNEGDDVATTNYKTDEVPTIQGYTIPTLGEWGMIAFTLLMGIGGVWQIRKVV